MNFLANYFKKRQQKKLYRNLIKVHQSKIYGLEMAQEVCWAEIQAVKKEESEKKRKVEEMAEAMKEKYGESNKEVESLELEINALFEAETNREGEKVKELKAKVEKVKEIIRARNQGVDVKVLEKELRELAGLKKELKTIPKRIEGQERNVQEQIDAIGRNEMTIKLIKDKIRKI